MLAGAGAPPDPPAKNRGEAINRYRHRLQVSLGRVCNGQWYAGSAPGGPGDVLVLTTNPWPMRITNQSGVSIYLFAEQRFSVGHVTEGPNAGQWKVKTQAYVYSLGDTAHPNEAWIHWHWHPPMRDHPHLHIKSDGISATDREGVRGHHVPTGRVSFEAVLRYLVEDCEVNPREGGRQVLDENEDLFRRFRTWG